VFAEILSGPDAERVTGAIAALTAHRFDLVLTGSLAFAIQQRIRGKLVAPGGLNDIDLVVSEFAALPESLSRHFLVSHVHPHAPVGKLLLQLIDERRALRIDIFHAVGSSMARAQPIAGALRVLSVEDLLARTVVQLCDAAERQFSIDPKHAAAFSVLRGLADPPRFAQVWHEHVTTGCTEAEGLQRADSFLALHPELLVPNEYSATFVPCPRCCAHAAFPLAAPEKVVEILGYW